MKKKLHIKPKANKPKENSKPSLSKFIAIAGVCSRRKATELIEQGHVIVNEVIEREPGRKVGPNDVVRAFGEVVKQQSKIYILLNKPKDYITTVSDEKGRRSVMELIDRPMMQRIYPVGRLDRATTGLLLLTNDGDLTLQLAHPRNHVIKTYEVTLDSALKHFDFQKIKEGVMLEDGKIVVDDLIYVPGERKNCVAVQVHSGKNRIVRRIFEHFGYNVKKLDRIGYDRLTKDGLKSGQWRHLTPDEVADLKRTK